MTNIENLTLKEMREIANLVNGGKSQSSNVGPWEIGKQYFVRTVTMYIVGKLKQVFESELVFEKASWVSDSGRFHDTLKKGLNSSSVEIEPFVQDVIIGRGSIIDATEFSHTLPTEQK